MTPVPDDAPTAPQQHPRRGKSSGYWAYRDATGKLLGYVLRFDQPDGSKEFLPATYCETSATGARQWRFKAWLPPRPLYGLDRLAQRPIAPVVVVEGEKTADAAAELLPDYVVVTSPNGAKSASKADWRVLAGRDVTLWPDNDNEGRFYAATAARLLHGVAASVKITASTPGTPEKWDAADALAEGWDQAKTASLIRAAVPTDAGTPATGAPNKQGGGGRPRQSDQLLDFLPEIDLWHSPDREAFATIRVAGHFENWPVRSTDFREWLSGRFFTAAGAAPSNQATEDALRVMVGRAKHDGVEYPVLLRLGERDGAVFIDLGDAQWRAIKVTGRPQRWDIIDRPPVKFIRAPAMRPLPMPAVGGKIEDELRDLVNVRDEADFKVFVAFLVGCFNSRGTYPILAVNGEQGSAKTTLCKLARRLTDPNAAPLRMLPHNMDELIVMARNAHVLAFDNVSDIPNWLSDALCSIASGGGHATREHYSNYNEVVFEGHRPVMLNGIPDLGSRPDFADRTVHVTLKPIPASERRSEVKYWREVDTRLPLIFGALLDAVAGALRNRDIVPPPVTRMADFETWVCAAEPALGWKEGEFIAAYTGNRQGTIEAALEADPLAGAVRQLVEKEDWSGSPTELLTRLDGLVSDGVRKGRTWPAAANALKKRLQRWQTALRETGVLLDLDGRSNDRKRGRFYSIRRDRGTEPS